MPILKEQISRPATHSGLEFTPSEIEKYSYELNQILDYFKKIASSLSVDEAQTNAPAQKDNYFMVPRVI